MKRDPASELIGASAERLLAALLGQDRKLAHAIRTFARLLERPRAEIPANDNRVHHSEA